MSTPEHHFSARGIASLIRLLRDSRIQWAGRAPLLLSTTPETELQIEEQRLDVVTGLAVLRPHGRVLLQATFPNPAYVVSTQCLLETIRSHFVLDVKFQSGWHDNLWPDYLHYFLNTRRWPDSAHELGPIFATALRRGATAEYTQRIRRLPWRARLRRGFGRTLLARVGRQPIARGMAHEHWKALSRAFFNSPDHEAMVAAAALTDRIQHNGLGCAVLAASWEKDVLTPVMPPTLARASEVSFEGLASIEIRDELRQRTVTHGTATRGLLRGGVGVAVPGSVRMEAEAAHVCLVHGEKRAYGATMRAPIVCKGTAVEADIAPNTQPWWRRLHHWYWRWRDPDWVLPERHNPCHLRVRARGEEA